MDKPKTPPSGDDGKRQQQFRSLAWYTLAALVLVWLFQDFALVAFARRASEISYSEFKAKLHAGQVAEALVGRDRIRGELKAAKPGAEPTPFTTAFEPEGDPKLGEELDSAAVKYGFEKPASPIAGFLLSWVLPIAMLFGFSRLAARYGAGGAGAGIFGVGKSKAQVVRPEEVGVTFKDVGGADEAIAELQEIIQFLREPESFASLGGRIPKGVLLVGPPGTGKTLLAKATAGEAKVAFFETSGSEFVEMFVGVGAARVRDLFEQARKAAPAIVFIDEIDAIGQSRGGTIRLGGNDEREQTLNQLLGEIDGFKTEAGRPVILMAATNRPEILDPALLRAGRFDRQIAVGNPDLIGRAEILRIHTRKIHLAPDFDIDKAAQMTPGFSGADLANVVNEAALLAARRKAAGVSLGDFQVAIERVVAGLEKKTRVMNDRERNTVAHHEAGHALVASLVKNADPVTKVSIVPHSRGALGYTMQAPAEDRFLLGLEELQDRLAVMLGGRAAEKIVFDTISTGASDDIQRATDLARRMVTEFGMSDKLGSVRYAGQQFQYLGGAVGDGGEISPHTHEVIDDEVQRIVTEQYDRARALLKARRAALEAVATQLLKEETVDGAAVRRALETNPATSATQHARA
ncbi:MAG TPA: ATP-dependent zinc metalloprotease FtsH [Myxococcales bacterium]|nr:ATP-dependent zinc metalloprotease FtsH [Myxococcales bacterium]